MHKENLTKLARYLLGPLKTGFDMKSFVQYDTHESYPCGTAACAVGHGPLLGFERRFDENWFDYSARWFLSFWDKDHFWDWCFCAKWMHFDNTPEGAAFRILFLLEETNEGMVVSFTEQILYHEGPERPALVEYEREKKAFLDGYKQKFNLLSVAQV